MLRADVRGCGGKLVGKKKDQHPLPANVKVAIGADFRCCALGFRQLLYSSDSCAVLTITLFSL